MASVELKTKDGKLVGTLKGGVLYKNVRKSRHYFNSVGDRGGWGIDYEVLFERLPERSSVYITDLENGVLYMSTAANWKEYGVILHFKEGTEDHYVQCFLPVEYFNRVNKRA